MGWRPAPDYANLVMATMDKKILDLAKDMFKSEEAVIKYYKRFLDDIYILFKGSYSNLHLLLSEINKLHPTLKFTMEHLKPEACDDCDCNISETIPFLDTQSKIENRKVIVDLYRKKTDRCMYLLNSSCHVAHVTANIPFSLCLRIVRICSKIEDRDKRLGELRDLLLSRKYKPGIIDAAIKKAKDIPRTTALQRVTRAKTNRPVMVVNHDPRLPSITKILHKHWRTMIQNPHMEETFPDPPLTAYKRPKNLKDILIKAKLPPPPARRPKRIVPGMKKCGKMCPICPFVKEGKSVKAKHSNFKMELNRQHTCDDTGVIYLVECTKCGQQYCGQSKNRLRDRFSNHLGYVRTKKVHQATGHHFNNGGCKIHHMSITVLEKVKTNTLQYRLTREKYYIEKFNLKYRGLNRNGGG